MKTRVVGEFEASNIYQIKEITPIHFTCEMKPESPSIFIYPDHHGYWFFLKVQDAKEKEVTIDITNCEWMPSHWKRYKPIVTYSDPNHLSNQHWETINRTNQFATTFRFIHTYSANDAWIALRYPYTYTYHQRYLETIRNNPLLEIESIVRTRENRSLDVIKITGNKVPISQKKGAIIYAREHGVEQEGSWVCQGVIDFLLSEVQEAVTLREKTIIFIIPMLAPDAASHGRCTDPYTGGLLSCDFTQNDVDKMKMDESKAILRKIRSVADRGSSIDICISLHSPHGWEENIWANIHDRIKQKEGKMLTKAIFGRCNGFTKRGPEDRWGRFSLPGRCAEEFKSIALLLEINQHAKRRFLSIEDLRRLGSSICKGLYDYFDHERGNFRSNERVPVVQKI